MAGLRRRLAGGVALGFAGLLALSPAVSAGATLRLVTISSFAFTPIKVVAAQGDAVRWQNDHGFTHSITNDGTLAFWPSTDLDPTEHFDKVFKAAGTFRYHCRFHPDMVGAVKVPVLVSMGTGGITVRAAAADFAGTSPFRIVIQRKGPSSTTWTTISSSRAAVVMVPITTGGTYAFRAAVRRASNGAMSGWSQVASIVV